MLEHFFKDIHEIPPQRELCRKKISLFFSDLPRALKLSSKSPRSKDTVLDLDSYDHLLEFFYFLFVYGKLGQHQRVRRMYREITSWNRYYSVNELKNVGISFEPSNTRVFTNVKFKQTMLGEALRIPPLIIEDSTKSLLLNLAAYETCAGWDSAKCTSYVCLMRSLIDKPEDVKELRSKGILRTTIRTDDQIAQIFREIKPIWCPTLLLIGRSNALLNRIIEAMSRDGSFKIRVVFLQQWSSTLLFLALQ